ARAATYRDEVGGKGRGREAGNKQCGEQKVTRRHGDPFEGCFMAWKRNKHNFLFTSTGNGTCGGTADEYAGKKAGSPKVSGLQRSRRDAARDYSSVGGTKSSGCSSRNFVLKSPFTNLGCLRIRLCSG